MGCASSLIITTIPLVKQKDRQTKQNLTVLALVLLTMVSIYCYLVVRTAFFVMAQEPWQGKIVAFFLLLAESFVILHGFGYFVNIFQVLRRGAGAQNGNAASYKLTTYPPVAIIVSSFREPIKVVEDTLVCFYNLTYPNRHLYFLDDTRYDLAHLKREEMQAYRSSVDEMCKRIGVNLFRRSWRGAKAGMINDFLDFINGKPKAGFELSVFSQTARAGKEKYIIVFDADQNPFPDFVEPLVSMMEQNPKLAFIQTPQYYTNFETNRVALASGLQQAVFYEYICEGKSTKNAMFCCGTNVIFREEALSSVGGLDESSVTEDFATSLIFHMHGWESAYVSKVCAFGMGPEDLGGYFKQQFRWALGTIGVFRKVLLQLIRNPFKLRLAVWSEYILSGTHYFVGWVTLIMMLCPVLYLFSGVPTCFVRPDFYLLFFTPYIILSATAFFWTLKRRSYRLLDIYLGVLLNPVSFPVYIKASTLALLGVRGKFGVTPKGGSRALPATALWPQILVALLCLSACVWGLNRLAYERENIWALLTNCFWCLYFFAVLSGVLYFNNPEEDSLSRE